MYVRLFPPAGAIKGVPIKVAMARNVPIVAMTIPLTNGVMVQAFRMTASGLEEIKINNQPARTQFAVTVSPNGRWLMTGLNTASSPGFTLFEYNYETGEYNLKRNYPNFVTYRPYDFEWLSEDIVAAASSGIANQALGNIRLDNVSGSGEILYNQISGMQYGCFSLHRTSSNRNLVAGIWDGGGGVGIRTFSFNDSTNRIALTTTSQFANGGPILSMKKDGSRIVSSRPGSTNLQSASGIDAGFALSTTNVQNINSEFNWNVQIDDSLVMINLPNGQFTFHQYQANNTVAEIPAPAAFRQVVELGRTLTWIKNTNYNGYLVGHDNTPDLWVYYPLTQYDTSIVTNINSITTEGNVAPEVATNTAVVLNNITTQLISGEDQSSTSLNLKLMPAYIEVDGGQFGQFSYESFNQQYMHGKTHFKQVITTNSTLFIEPQIDSDLLIPSPFVDGLIALPPQFEGDTNIAKFTTQANLKSDDFFSGDTLVGIKVVNEGRLSGGETIESFAFINSIISSGILKSEIGVITDTLIPGIGSDGLIKPDVALYGDGVIPVIKSDGFVNNPWTIDSDTLIPNKFVMGGWVNNPYLSTSEITLPPVVTTSFVANGEEGLSIDFFLSSLVNDIRVNVIKPEELAGDVVLKSITTDGEITDAKNLTGDTVIPSFDMQGFLQKTIELDSVVDLPKLISDGFLELITVASVDTSINKIQTDVLIKFLRRKRYLNLI